MVVVPEAGRRHRVQGNVEVAFILSTEGKPQQIRVTHGLGLGLDEKAIEAVRQYRYKPATRAGVPVPVAFTARVSFQIY